MEHAPDRQIVQSIRKQKPQVRLYRFFNMERDKHGEPFALCDVCVEKQRVPKGCLLNRIADGALMACKKCGARN